jgi:hypothetical protein
MSDWILPSRGFAPATQGGITIAFNKTRGNAREVAFTIRQDVMKAMRWMAGERVAIRIEPKSRTITQRRHPYGFKLSARGLPAKKAAGRAVTCALKLRQDFSGARRLSDGFVALNECHHDGEDLVMTFPVGSERAA